MRLAKYLKYIVMFIWVIVFFYNFNMFMPRNLLYLLIGLPVSMFSTFFIYDFFRKRGF